MRKSFLPAALVLVGTLSLAGCSGSSSSKTAEPKKPEIDLSMLDHGSAQHCDHLDTSHCMFPFPSNHLTRPDTNSATGLRINFAQEGMPLASPVNIPKDGARLFVDIVTDEATRTTPDE